MARRSNAAPSIGALPANASLAAVDADSQAWLKTSIMRNTNMPIAKALRNPFFFGLRCWSAATGRPKKIVKQQLILRVKVAKSPSTLPSHLNLGYEYHIRLP